MLAKDFEVNPTPPYITVDEETFTMKMFTSPFFFGGGGGEVVDFCLFCQPKPRICLVMVTFFTRFGIPWYIDHFVNLETGWGRCVGTSWAIASPHFPPLSRPQKTWRASCSSDAVYKTTTVLTANAAHAASGKTVPQGWGTWSSRSWWASYPGGHRVIPL